MDAVGEVVRAEATSLIAGEMPDENRITPKTIMSDTGVLSILKPFRFDDMLARFAGQHPLQ